MYEIQKKRNTRHGQLMISWSTQFSTTFRTQLKVRFAQNQNLRLIQRKSVWTENVETVVSINC